MISKPWFIYLQRPDNCEWVTVGRYLYDEATQSGDFKYAPSYLSAGFAWSIDPINLPLIPGFTYQAARYRGLHDVLRDAGPDSFGKLLIQRAAELSSNAPEYQYLLLSDNAHRWGALAIGKSKAPNVAKISTPRLPDLKLLAKELLAIAERRPPIDAKLRRRLVGTPSAGGARPKATIKDGATRWLVKPMLPTDTLDIPLLEHATQRWGSLVGLCFAKTVIHRLTEGQSVVRVLRFDREGERRFMTLSAAAILQTEYPALNPTLNPTLNPALNTDDYTRWSYPRLAEELKWIGAPTADLQEIFGRMIFNALVGNDDDHPRNHAVIYQHEFQRWTLAPAFDVVPHPEKTPLQLAMQLSTGSRRISRDNILANFIRFGFNERADAEQYLNILIS